LKGAEKFDGQVLFSPTVFNKTLQRFAQTEKGAKNRLDILFKNNPNLLDELKNLEEVAKDLSPPGRAVPKGSAPILLDLAESMKKIPGLGLIGSSMESILNIGSDPRAIARAVATDPQFSKSVRFIKDQFPSLAVALGIGALSGEVERRKQDVEIIVDLPGEFDPETGLFPERDRSIPAPPPIP
jgi:hypothetical protein